jgi:hypothetical protein
VRRRIGAPSRPSTPACRRRIEFSKIWSGFGSIPAAVRVAYMGELVHLHLPADRAALDAAVQRAEMAAMEELVHSWHDKDSLLAQGDSDSATARLAELQAQLLLIFPQLYAGLLAANQQQSSQPCSDALRRCSTMLAAAAGLPEPELERQWLDCWACFDSGCLAPAQVGGCQHGPFPWQPPCHAGLTGPSRASVRCRGQPCPPAMQGRLASCYTAAAAAPATAGRRKAADRGAHR